jgi:hypothetical protein
MSPYFTWLSRRRRDHIDARLSESRSSLTEDSSWTTRIPADADFQRRFATAMQTMLYVA